MFSNIGKKIQLLSLILAGLTFVSFVALGALCLIAALGAGVNEELSKAGIQAAVISFVLALILPLCSWILYGFGEMVTASKKQAEDTKEIKEMLRSSLSEGLLSDEIARKMGQVLLKLQQTQAQAQPQAPQQAGQRSRAPVQRFVEEPVAPQPAPQPVYQAPAPVQPAYQPTPAAPAAVEAPVEAPAAPVAQPAAPAAPIAPAAPAQAAYTVKPATAIGEARPLQRNDEEAF